MNRDFPPNGSTRPLGALGISELEERVYSVLLAHRMTTAEDVARLLDLSGLQAQQLLDDIETKGLATHSLEHPPRYIPAPPELAIEALASQRQADIERARLTIPRLKDLALKAAMPPGHEQVVELITNRTTLNQILMHLHQTVQHEAIGFQRAPMIVSNSHQQEMRPGIRIRSISDNSYLQLPGALESLRQLMKMGEDARFFSTLPVKMFIVDKRIGLIPLNTEDLSGPILLVRASALLDALCVIFELIWERATPMLLTRSGKLEIGSPNSRLAEEIEQLIPLLATGLNDKAIAYELGISAATLTRRISELMKSMGTRTRFQLGWRAALDMYSSGPAIKHTSPGLLTDD
jgi:hypothetical protein